MTKTKPTVKKITKRGLKVERISWGPNYRLVNLTSFKGTIALPGETSLVSFKDLKEHSDSIVFSDKSGGGTTFKAWWLEHLKNNGSLMLVSDAKATTLLNDSDNSSEPENDLGEKLKNLHRLQSAEDIYEYFVELNKLNRSVDMVFYNPSDFSSSSANIFQALRSVRDDERLFSIHHLRVMIINNSDGPFLSTLENSPYLPIANCFRIAFFTTAEIEALGRYYFKSEPNVELVELIEKRTGGHSCLVQVLIKNIRGSHKSLTSSSQIESAYRKMKKEPPDVAKIWMTRLTATLEKQRELILSLKAYLNGQTLGKLRMPPPAIERSLFIGGWLRQYGNGRWGISSDFHAHLARRVLLRMGVEL